MERKFSPEDGAAVVGVCPCRSPLDVFVAKSTGVERPRQLFNPPSPWAEITHQMEALLLRCAVEARGLNPKANVVRTSRREPLLTAIIPAVDWQCRVGAVSRWITDVMAVLEDEPPDWLWVEAQHMAAAANLDAIIAAVGAVENGRVSIRLYEIPRNLEAIEALEKLIRRFYREHVETRIPPYHFNGLEVLKARWEEPKARQRLQTATVIRSLNRIRSFVFAEMQSLGDILPKVDWETILPPTAIANRGLSEASS